MSAADVTPEEAELWERIREAQRGRLRAAMFRVDTVATLIQERDQLRAQLAACPAPVAVEVPEILSRLSEWEEFRSQFSCLSYHHSGMGCGIEDRGIHDRYEACEYGWEEAMERVAERMPEEHGELPEIDPSRILKDGEREELELLRNLRDEVVLFEWASDPRGDGDPAPHRRAVGEIIGRLNALRSGEAAATPPQDTVTVSREEWDTKCAELASAIRMLWMVQDRFSSASYSEHRQIQGEVERWLEAHDPEQIHFTTLRASAQAQTETEKES